MIAQDAAYNEMYLRVCPSQHPAGPGAKDVAIEFHSLSKTFNMTGWRVGFAIGGAPMIAALGQVKANTDSGIFTAIQFAGKTALDEYDTLTPPIRALYKERRDAFVRRLKKIGWDVPTPAGHLLRLDPLPQGLYLDRAVQPAARRGRCRHHARASASAGPPTATSAPP